MKTYIAYRNFTMCKALVLAALIGASTALAPLYNSDRHPVAKATKHQDYGAYESGQEVIRVRAAFRDDGTVMIEGPSGQLEGTWHDMDGHICVQFDHAPKTGLSCEI